MLNNLHLENILFLDIETVPEIPDFNALDEEKKKLWEQKSSYQRKDEFSAEEFYPRAGIWAEFGKIIVISVGFIARKGAVRNFRVTSFSGVENDLLLEFKKLLDEHFNQAKHLLCAHNGKEFDFPYIARRMLIHGIPLPNKLDLFGKKPWEVPHLDTMELWKFGDLGLPIMTPQILARPGMTGSLRKVSGKRRTTTYKGRTCTITTLLDASQGPRVPIPITVWDWCSTTRWATSQG